MEIAAVTGYRYRLPLREPLVLGGSTLTAREGLLVRIASGDGVEGWGDMAPLLGFSTESLDVARDALAAVAPSLHGQSPRDAIDCLAEAALAPSVRCGLELALFDLQAQATGTPLPRVLDAAPRPVVSLNGLITAQGDEALAAADRFRADGYRAVKLKVGRRSVDEDVALVRHIKARLGAVALRLDANRAWSLDEAYTFAGKIEDVPIEYIEEPLADASALPFFAAETGLPVALDETVQEGAAPAAYARAIIIKPTLVGGITGAQRLAREAESVGVMPVLSAAFESGVGLRGLVALAAGLGAADVPVGLDTGHWLAADVLRPGLRLDGPHVDVAAVVGADRSLDYERLENELSITA